MTENTVPFSNTFKGHVCVCVSQYCTQRGRGGREEHGCKQCPQEAAISVFPMFFTHFFWSHPQRGHMSMKCLCLTNSEVLTLLTKNSHRKRDKMAKKTSSVCG